jgi:LPS-assembly protein
MFVLVTLAVSASAFLGANPALAIVDKPLIKPVTTKPSAGTPADFEADRITYDPRKKVAVATGKVVIVYGPYVLNATRVVYDEINDTFNANGSVELREPNGNILQAEEAELYNRFKEGFARHLKALLTNDVTITADYAKRTDDDLTVYERASYTACKDCKTRFGQPLWEIRTTKTIHDSEKKDLYHYNPTLRIGGVPVFYLPYAQQPDPTVRRRTGFLPPNFKYGELYGIGVITPYFQELGKSADLTFSPIWTTKQGPVADLEYRQRTSTGQFNIRGYGVYQLSPRDSDPSYPNDDARWRGAVTSAGEFNLAPGWSYGWDGTLTSDRKFLDHYDFDDRQFIESNAHLTGIAGRSYFDARALHYRTTIVGDQQSELAFALPYIDSEYTLEQAVLGGELSFDWNIYSLSREDIYTPYANVNHAEDQTRFNGQMRWQRQMISNIGTVFTPFAKARGDVYITNELPDPAVAGGVRDSDVTARFLPSAGFDLRMPFIANYESGQSILTPVVQMVAAADEGKTDRIGNEDAISINFDSSSLFLEDRFTGLDRYEGGIRANAGLMYTYLGANGGYTRFSFGESFHIGGDNSFDGEVNSGLSGKKSDLVGALTWQPNSNFGVSYQLRVKEDLSRINTQEAYANFSFGNLQGNIGYFDLREEPTAGRELPMERVSAGLNYRFDEAWSVFGGASYDLENDKFISKYAGVAFDCDCMNARLTYTESGNGTLDSPFERQLRFSIELRTIGATSVAAGL